MIVVSTGCPASIGPELSLKAAARFNGAVTVLVGDEETLLQAADLIGLSRRRLRRLGDTEPSSPGIYLLPAGPALSSADRSPGAPSAECGAAQLAYVEVAFEFARQRGVPLVTAAVSKAAIAHSGLRRARRFRGHTEWLEQLDGSAPGAVTMCFFCDRLATSLVTTHLPLKRVPRAITADGVCRATVHLARLLRGTGVGKPRIAVASLNPHAGESELLGLEEERAIVPGLHLAKKHLRQTTTLSGPVGAETAYRRAAAGHYDGVVAMYHDQATIPMKLLAFGDAVNVTMGLSIVRTSVDHGTAYDIAWQNEADDSGMLAAMTLAAALKAPKRTKQVR